MINPIFSISKWMSKVYLVLLLLTSCQHTEQDTKEKQNDSVKNYSIISRAKYHDQLYGFWLGECIANWTGLVTEMDKIGNIGDIQTGDFYTREDWGKPEKPNIWGENRTNLSSTINFVFKDTNAIWGADDDTDIEYIYQHLMYTQQTSILSGEQIREGWLKHIMLEEENFLWVSNQEAYNLMQKGLIPPETSNPKNNKHYSMIDAQLTTEIFGLFAPGRPDIALKMAYLPIHTTAQKEAALIADFYVVMYSLASMADTSESINNQSKWIACEAREIFADSTYPAKMYDYVKSKYDSGISWEQARDSIYYRYQVNQKDGYKMTSNHLYCNGCFAAGINFAASLVSYFYGEGDIVETIKIGSLMGWDSDNPTATWGGLLGFMIGKEGVEAAFQRKFSNRFNIHRTRQNFPNNGIDTFDKMADKGLKIIDRAVQKEMEGIINSETNSWYIPKHQLDIHPPIN